MEYYAHSSEDGTRLQTVAEHLKGTAEKCRAFAAEFGAESIGSLMGNVHDVGKCTEEFQNRLLNDGPKVDHSTAGAVLCAYLGQLWAAECVAGHHSGLPDFGNLRLDRPGEGTLCGRLQKGKDRIREILVNHGGINTDCFKVLGALIGLDRGNTHLGSNLYDTM
mgnify:CR=1 FL=1